MRGLLIPTFTWDTAFWTTVVAILGTTISPYLFFWQAAQEVEDIRAVRERKPLIKAPEQGDDAIERIRLDTYVGMAFSNLIALAIIVTTAATLHANGVTDIATRARQPRPCDRWLARLHLRCLRSELWAPACSQCRCWRDRLLMLSGRRDDGRWVLRASRCRPKHSTRPLRCDAHRREHEFPPYEPHQGALLDGRHQRHRGRSRDGYADAYDGNPKIMGNFPVRDGLRLVGWISTAVMATAAAAMVTTALL